MSAPVAISLESGALIPEEIVRLIQPLNEELMNNRYVDSFARLPKFQRVLARMTDYLEKHRIICVHYTRAVPEDILAAGLICATGAQRRTWFMEKYGNLFCDPEREAIKTAWRQYFKQAQNAARDNKVFFNLSTTALRNGGAGPLLENFGGEAINMPLLDLPRIKQKLNSLGSPLIVKCALKPSRLLGCWEYPAAVVWLSAYQTKVNPKAALYDVDVYTTSSVLPEDIITIDNATRWD